MIGKVMQVLSGGVLASVENIAKEWIETDHEKAEAKALMIKTLDPNGLLRRQISRTVSALYVLYTLLLVVLLLAQAFNLSELVPSGQYVGVGENAKPIMVPAVSMAIDSIKDLFVPVTSSFTAIVAASFGTNMFNIHKENKEK